jgi:hypothetical protein
MRCPKCGTISFDHVKQCEKCGRDLSSVSELLGIFYSENRELDWFNLSLEPAAVDSPEAVGDAPPEIVMPDTPPQVLEGIDISDLVETKPSEVEADLDINMELDELQNITLDEDFNNALDEVIE